MIYRCLQDIFIIGSWQRKDYILIKKSVDNHGYICQNLILSLGIKGRNIPLDRKQIYETDIRNCNVEKSTWKRLTVFKKKPLLDWN